MTLPPRVFVSYHRGSPEAFARAHQLAPAIEAREAQCFLDDWSIEVSDDWTQRIYEALFEYEAAVLLLTREGLAKSEWLLHEASLLASRWRGWRDVVLVVVPLDIPIADVPPALSQAQALAEDQDSPDAILAALESGWAAGKDGVRRRRRFEALAGHPRVRAERFRRAVASRMPDDAKVVAALQALELPRPPTSARIGIRDFAAGLLLTEAEPERFLAALRDAGAARNARALRSYLLPRGLLDTDPLSWHLGARIAWSFRNWLFVWVPIAFVVAIKIQGWAESRIGRPGDASTYERSLLAAFVAFVLMCLVVVVLRWVAFELRVRVGRRW